MHTSEILYLGDLRTEATHMRSGMKITTVAPPDNQGKGDAFSPTDLASTALGSCMMTIMAIAARTHEIDMEGTRAQVLKIMADNPRRIASVEIDMFMPAKHFTDKEKKILEHAAHACPVSRSLHPDLVEIIRFHWQEE